jgi:hypothetical protein
VNSRTDIHNELSTISETVAKIPFCNIYDVPADEYFQSICAEILVKIQDVNHAEFAVPDGYFESLSGEILNKIKQEGNLEEELPEMLKSIRHINVYSTPENYFNSLQSSVLKRTASKPKVIGLERKFSFIKYAVAASVAALIGIGIYKVSNNVAISDEVSLSSILKTASAINKNNSFDKEMSDLPDEEIISYLNEKGEDVNTALVASLSDEENLPEADEYLLDENRLDNYLNENNIIKHTSNQDN